MEKRVNLRLEPNSKVFMSLLKSALYVLLLPMLISIALAAMFLMNMEKEAEGFRSVALEQLTGEVNQEFWSAYQLIKRVKNSELIVSYAKSKERDYWTEYQIHKYMSKVLVGTNLETAYLYFPQYEMVFSVTGGVESGYFHELNYGGSFEEWQEALKSRWNGKSVQLSGKSGERRNLIVSSVLNSGKQDSPVTIAVQIRNEYMDQMAANLQLEEHDKLLIYNSNGIIGSSFDADAQKELAELFQAAGWRDGDRVSFGGITYAVRIRYSSQYGLTFVYASPKDMTHSSFVFVRVYSAVALGLCIVLSILLCLALTNRNYSPIKRIFGLFREAGNEDRAVVEDYDKMERYINDYIARNQKLQSTVKRYEEDYRKIYLEKILYGRIPYREGIEEGGRLYGLGLDAPWFAVVLYELAETSEEGLFGMPEEAGVEVLRDSLGAYIEEKMEYVARFYIIEEQNGCIAVLNGEAADAKEFGDRIRRDNAAVLEEMEVQEEICCEAYVSDGLEGLARLQEGYEQLRQRQKESEIQEVERGQSGSENCLRIDRIIEAVRRVLSDPDLSVAGLADRFAVSPSHLSRFFKQQMGVGLLDYIHRCRIDEAKTLMKDNPAIRVKEVADRTGFYNVSAFIRVFKKIEHMTPGQYREKI